MFAGWLLRNRLLLAALAALLLAANVFLLAEYNRGGEARQIVKDKAQAAVQELKALEKPGDPEDLGREVARSEEMLASAERIFDLDVPPFDLVVQLNNAATEAGVGIVQMRAEPITRERLGLLDAWTVRHSLEVRGSMAPLVAFLERVERGPQATMVVEGLSFAASGNEWVVRMQVVVYTRREPQGAGPAGPGGSRRPQT